MSPNLGLIRRTLFELSLKAGQAAFQAQKTTKTVKDTGGGAGITTQADLDAQKIVSLGLQRAFPNVPIVGEEDNKLSTCPKEAFIIDPIDGSAPYKAGAPFFGTTIACLSPTAAEGVIYQPALGKLYLTNSNNVVVYESGASFDSPTRMLISLLPRKPQWKICVPITREFSDKTWHNVFIPILLDQKTRSLDNVACNVVHMCWLFEGWVDAVISYAKIWDIAAAIAMAKRLGVLVTDFGGNGPDLSVIDPQRTIFARGEDVLKTILEYMKNWPSPSEELRSSIG